MFCYFYSLESFCTCLAWQVSEIFPKVCSEDEFSFYTFVDATAAGVAFGFAGGESNELWIGLSSECLWFGLSWHSEGER